jgi:membrane peptidoglycan carboxypeptidase
MPIAGKTGTTQNWADAWTVGYSTYYTTAIWFGFDRPGNSLGTELTGATLSGHVWGDYMREIHQGLPRRDFVRPSSGIIDVTVCSKSGLLTTPSCNEGNVTLPFLTDTQPTQGCHIHGNRTFIATAAINTMRNETLGMNNDFLFSSLTMPSLPMDLFPLDTNPTQTQNRPNSSTINQRPTNPVRNTNQPNRLPDRLQNNPLLDGDYIMPPFPETQNQVIQPEIIQQEIIRQIYDNVQQEFIIPEEIFTEPEAFQQEVIFPEFNDNQNIGGTINSVINDLPDDAEPLIVIQPETGFTPDLSEGLELPAYNPLLD